MFIRWSRSNVRENLEMFKFAFRRIDFTDEDLLGMQINLIMQTLWTLTPMLFVASTIYCLVVSPLTFLYASIMATLIWSTLPAFVYASKYSKKRIVVLRLRSFQLPLAFLDRSLFDSDDSPFRLAYPQQAEKRYGKRH